MVSEEVVVGILLAGGTSSRMGGGDKCLRPLAGRPVLDRIIERLKPQVAEMIVNANGEPSRFAEFNLPVIADRIPGFAGPLAGVHAGLQWIKGNRPSSHYAVTVATDTPFFPTDLVTRLLAERKGNDSLLVARSDEGLHPVIGLWPVSMIPALEGSLAQGQHKASAFVRAHGAIEVFFPKTEIGEKPIDPFFNINRPEDLAAADALLKEQAQ